MTGFMYYMIIRVDRSGAKSTNLQFLGEGATFFFSPCVHKILSHLEGFFWQKGKKSTNYGELSFKIFIKNAFLQR